jgi:Cu/Ag efflux protein CusF
MYIKSFVILALSISGSAAIAGDMQHMMGQHQHDAAAEDAAEAPGHAAPLTDGEILKVDAAAQKLTVRHGRIENLGMSPMTMVFRVKDPTFLSTVKPGDTVQMTVERVDGVLTIVALQRVP